MNDTTPTLTPGESVDQSEPTGAGAVYSGFWPLSLLAVSFFALLCWQLLIAYHQRQNMKDQIKQRGELVQQSQKVQEELKRLVDSLIKFAKYDQDAKGLLDKYGITPK